jgi:hypothetical protein
MTREEFDNINFRLGHLRGRIAQTALEQALPGYVVGMVNDEPLAVRFGQKSAVFVPAISFSSKEMKAVSSKHDVKTIILTRLNARSIAKDDESGEKTVIIRVALGAMKCTDEPYQESYDDDQIISESQNSFNSPKKPPAKEKHNSRAAKTSHRNAEVDAFVRNLYINEESSFYHGFTRAMAAIIRARASEGTSLEDWTSVVDAGSWPTKQQLLGYESKMEPRRGMYPPDVDGNFPSGQLPKSATPIEQLVVAMKNDIVARRQLASPHALQFADAPSAGIARRQVHVSFSRVTQTETICTDVMIADEFGGDEFDGKALFLKAFALSNGAGNGLFDWQPEEMVAIQSKTRKVHFTFTAGGPTLHSDLFYQLGKDTILSYADPITRTVAIEITLHAAGRKVAYDPNIM